MGVITKNNEAIERKWKGGLMQPDPLRPCRPCSMVLCMGTYLRSNATKHHYSDTDTHTHKQIHSHIHMH